MVFACSTENELGFSMPYEIYTKYVIRHMSKLRKWDGGTMWTTTNRISECYISSREKTLQRGTPICNYPWRDACSSPVHLGQAGGVATTRKRR